MKSRTDVYRAENPFEVGGEVLLLTMVPAANTAKSFRVHYTGPFLILDMTSSVNALILHMHSGDTKVVNIYRLKPYFGPRETLRPLMSTVEEQPALNFAVKRKRGRPRKSSKLTAPSIGGEKVRISCRNRKSPSLNPDFHY